MKRKNGFYWVKWQGKWEVLEWYKNAWAIAGIQGYNLTDEQTDQIDENQIINPNIN